MGFNSAFKELSYYTPLKDSDFLCINLASSVKCSSVLTHLQVNIGNTTGYFDTE
jgi:hypothetical protein